jgi:hypothetical protein
MQRFRHRGTLKNYYGLLAKERSETERMFVLKVLTRKEAENRHRSQRGWVVVQAPFHMRHRCRPASGGIALAPLVD